MNGSALRFPTSKSFDYVFANLEGPILETESLPAKQLKAGPHIYNNAKSLGDSEFQISNWVFSGANNHLMDFGTKGLEETLKYLENRGSKLLGAGLTLEDSRRGLVLTCEGQPVCFVSCSEKTFRTSLDESPGIAEAGDWIHSLLAANREAGIKSVILHHGGTEDYSLPSPQTVEMYRSWIDAGAMLVIGTHPHVVQPFEKYKDGHIFYGLGNFAVEPSKWSTSDDRNLTSLLVSLEFTNVGFGVSAQLVTCRAGNDGDAVEIQITNESRVFEYLDEIAALIRDRALHERVWRELVKESFTEFFQKHLRFALIFELLYLSFPKIIFRKLKFLNQPFLFDLMAWRSNRLIIENSLAQIHGHDNRINDDEALSMWNKIRGFEFRK